MTTEEKMMQPRRLKSAIRRLEIEIDSLYAMALPAGVRYDQDRVQTSPKDKMAEVAARADELERELRGEICAKQSEMLDAIMEVGRLIDSIENDRQKEALTAYYIRGDSVGKIAREMIYSREGIYKLLKRGIKSVHKVDNGM